MRRVLGIGALLLGAVGVYLVTGGGGGSLGLAVGQCGISVTSPARARDGKVYLRSGQSLTVAMTGTASKCPNTTLTRRFDDGGSASITVDDAGMWSHSAAVADGVTTTITVSSVDGGSAPLVVDALTSSPRIQLTAPARDDWDVWYLVASKVDAGCGSGGNLNAERFGRTHYLSDISCEDGGQFNPSVTVTGASGGWLSVTWNGTALVDAGVTSSPQTLTQAQLGTLTLPDLQSGELTFTATTAGGVSTSLITYPTVRTLTPPNLYGADGGSPVLTLTDYRRASVQVDYVLPHIPEEIGTAHTEFVWTTGSVPCGGAQSNVGIMRGTCYSLTDADAGFYLVNSSTTSPAICGTVAVPDGGCAYGSSLIWVKSDGGYSRASTAEYQTGVVPEAGDRLGVAALEYSSISSCTGGSIRSINPVGACMSPVERPPANAYNMADGGGSARDHWDRYYQPTGFHRAFEAYPVFDSNVPLYPSNANSHSGYLSARRELQDCRLYDAEASPQVWRCTDGATVLEGEVRHGVIPSLPPINTYGILPVLAW